MNELEKEIEERSNEYSKKSYNEVFQQGHIDDFQAGCNFILEKNITGQFADWIGDRFEKSLSSGWFLKQNNLTFGDFKHSIDGMQVEYTTEQIKSYWLNNVYGK